MGRQTACGLIFSRGGSSITVTDKKSEGGNTRCCRKVGCSASVYSTKDNKIQKPEELQPSDGQTQAGCFSKSLPWHLRSAQREPRTRTTNRQNTTSERSGGHKRLGKSESNSCIGKAILGCIERKEKQEPNLLDSSNQTVSCEPSKLDSITVQGSCENGSKRSRRSTSLLGSKVLKKISNQSNSGSHSNPCLSERWSSASRNDCETPKHASEDSRTDSSTYGSKRVTRSAISNVAPSISTPNESDASRQVSALRKRSSTVATLSVNGKSSSAPSVNKHSGSLQSTVTRISNQHNLTRNASSSIGQSTSVVALSVRTRRAPRTGTRTMLSQQVDRSILSLNSTSTAQESQTEGMCSQSSSRFSVNFPVQSDAGFPSGSRNQIPPGGNLCDSQANRIGRHRNVEGAAEALMTLERIEQDDLSYEHLLVLGNNLTSAGLILYDQHRDMRMDIDNMSYEELLALEERIGTVSTALPEEALSKCMKRINYTPYSPSGDSSPELELKCSICQEEYVAGDDLGKLVCNHGYHITCIQQWLKFKNWCPICKTSLSSSS